MQVFYGLHFNNLRGDIYGGLTAAVVALPLALAFGVACASPSLGGFCARGLLMLRASPLLEGRFVGIALRRDSQGPLSLL